MAGSPADIRIAGAFGGDVVQSADRPGPASYDAAGLRYVFVAGCDDGPAWHYALDVERKDTRPDPGLAGLLRQILPEEPPLQTWTLIECLAKLRGRPAHLMLRDVLGARPGDATRLALGFGVAIACPAVATHHITVARIPAAGGTVAGSPVVR